MEDIPDLELYYCIWWHTSFHPKIGLSKSRLEQIKPPEDGNYLLIYNYYYRNILIWKMY